eukprot:5156999-Pyramimonas_sp.AAC.1
MTLTRSSETWCGMPWAAAARRSDFRQACYRVPRQASRRMCSASPGVCQCSLSGSIDRSLSMPSCFHVQ